MSSVSLTTRAGGRTTLDAEALEAFGSGTNYERLARLEKRYDPDNLFRVNQNVAPTRA